MPKVLAIAAACAALTLAACGEDGDGKAATTATTTAAEQPAAEKPAADPGDEGGGGGAAEKPGIEIATGESQFGEILYDGSDQAIYLFDKETSDTSECYGECATAWPPVLTKGEPQAGGGADDKLLGTTERDDGSTQVTYDGHPLYYYVDDPPGQVLCHNVDEFGGLWLVVEPSGEAVQ